MNRFYVTKKVDVYISSNKKTRLYVPVSTDLSDTYETYQQAYIDAMKSIHGGKAVSFKLEFVYGPSTEFADIAGSKPTIKVTFKNE